MSEINHDQFEAWVNRYLDGELTDDEFEQYLRSIDAGLDLEKLRLMKTRIEKIEELYRQIEEPAVPDGYWDEFADRVTARISPDTRSSLKDSILTLFLPSRWPNATYRYVGAVASVLVVFLIGKSLMKSGSDEYMPHDYPAAKVEQLPPSSSKQISIEEAGEEKRDVAEIAKPESEQVIDHAEQPIDESKPVPPATDAVVIDKAKRDIIEKSKPTSNVTITSEQMEVMPIKKLAGDQSTVTSEISDDALEELDAGSKTPTSVDGSSPVTALEKPPDEVIAEKIERRTETAQTLTNMNESAFESEIQPSAISVSRGRTAWKYDNWDLDSLHAQMSLYEKLITDLSFADSAFIEYAEIKSSIALITRDSTDIYDAISAIDSLLIRYPDADPQRWAQRRANLNRILENLNHK